MEGDIKACFDEISHPALMDRVRARISDKRVLDLVKAFLKAGILSEEGQLEQTTAGTPQGSILSPLLANVALWYWTSTSPGLPAARQPARRNAHGGCVMASRTSAWSAMPTTGAC